jgi:hypothetical protein
MTKPIVMEMDSNKNADIIIGSTSLWSVGSITATYALA